MVLSRAGDDAKHWCELNFNLRGQDAKQTTPSFARGHFGSNPGRSASISYVTCFFQAHAKLKPCIKSDEQADAAAKLRKDLGPPHVAFTWSSFTARQPFTCVPDFFFNEVPASAIDTRLCVILNASIVQVVVSSLPFAFALNRWS